MGNNTIKDDITLAQRIAKPIWHAINVITFGHFGHRMIKRAPGNHNNKKHNHTTNTIIERDYIKQRLQHIAGIVDNAPDYTKVTSITNAELPITHSSAVTSELPMEKLGNVIRGGTFQKYNKGL